MYSVPDILHLRRTRLYVAFSVLKVQYSHTTNLKYRGGEIPISVHFPQPISPQWLSICERFSATIELLEMTAAPLTES